MKAMRGFFVVVVAISCLLPFVAKGQTLGQVLRMVQNRRELLIERIEVENGWNHTVYNNFESLSGSQNDLIDWGTGDAYPTDAEINALSIDDQIGLLRQAWEEVDDGLYLDARAFSSGTGQLSSPYNFRMENTSRITIENFKDKMRYLAQMVIQLNTLNWPILWGYEANSLDDSNPSMTPPLPSPPLTVDADFDDWGGAGNSALIVADEGGSLVGFGNDPTGSYFYDAVISGTFQTQTPNSFGGTTQLYSDPAYAVNAVTGLSSGTTPEYEIIWSGGISSSNSTSSSETLPGIYGGGASSASFPGSYQEQDGNIVFVPILQDQNNQTLFGDLLNSTFLHNLTGFIGNGRNNFDSFVGGFFSDGSSSLALEYTQGFMSNAVFSGSFGTELSLPSQTIPEEAAPLQITPDLGNNRLLVRLASAPANDCELIWSFPNILAYSSSDSGTVDTGYSISERAILSVAGSGNWDAVYSGHPGDREPELQWTGGPNDSNGRWTSFLSYVTDWWRPVLTQLVTATYGLNITQEGRYQYNIDFYRKDQIGAKDPTTGRYSFSGSPIETWIVQNPTEDDSQAGSLEITTTNAVYNLTLAQEADDDSSDPSIDSSWTLTAQDQTTGAEFLDQEISVYPEQPYEVVNDTSVNGVALPEVTTTYLDTWANPQRTGTMTEDAGGADGTRTTAYSYNVGTPVAECRK